MNKKQTLLERIDNSVLGTKLTIEEKNILIDIAYEWLDEKIDGVFSDLLAKKIKQDGEQEIQESSELDESGMEGGYEA